MTCRLDTVAVPPSSVSFTQLCITPIPFNSKLPIQRSLTRCSVRVDVDTLEVIRIAKVPGVT
ncbi:hypothetical protein BpHYR1_050161 [Brachionus plicatilis]|uniref:Uncharacterized protein n=1 Tax=Brachionus plicatilis TaxID=10195 RepID=A0A3M7PX99_BRAPC|nr:hypothetical protein BpHYR1_050161 [Brachionus plicatilis]